MIFEAVAWYIAFKEFKAGKGKYGYLRAIQVSKDPSIFTVLLEDTAAMLGLIVAFAGILTGQLLGIPAMDGIATMVIGLILAMAAVLLAYETKGLLIGEGADPQIAAELRSIVQAHPSIFRINELLTLHQGPQDLLVTVSADFHPSLSSNDVEAAISDLELRMKKVDSAVGRISVTLGTSIALTSA